MIAIYCYYLFFINVTLDENMRGLFSEKEINNKDSQFFGNHFVKFISIALQWRHKELYGVSNLDCVLHAWWVCYILICVCQSEIISWHGTMTYFTTPKFLCKKCMLRDKKYLHYSLCFNNRIQTYLVINKVVRVPVSLLAKSKVI